MDPNAKKLRDIYAITPNAPFHQREFWLMSTTLEAWKAQGLADGTDLSKLFGFDGPGNHSLGQLGWCEAAFSPCFEDAVIEDRGEHEVVRDYAGRHVLVFKGRRTGFMPEYIDHPVKGMKSWEEDVKWRLNPDTPGRFADLEERMARAKALEAQGFMITQGLIGGYMYLRSLMGPEDLLCKFYDEPELIHDCMKTWLRLADAVIARHQASVTLDELFLAEDICYNHGPLIAPEMIREFLFPYYRELIRKVRARQLDPSRRLFLQVDTDGLANPVIPVYGEIGVDVMSPFEVASGCDVVAIGKAYPRLVMTGGIDKRILATTTEAIDRHLKAILPVMHTRGGYIPTIDHGVPEEVPLKNYLHYRKRVLEYA